MITNLVPICVLLVLVIVGVWVVCFVTDEGNKSSRGKLLVVVGFILLACCLTLLLWFLDSEGFLDADVVVGNVSAWVNGVI